MLKNVRWVAAVLLAAFGMALAGEIVLLKCDGCDHKFSRVFTGCGRKGIEKTTVYCGTCRDFSALATARRFGNPGPGDSVIVKPKGKAPFLGEERVFYACQKCGGEAFVYTGPVCPVCRKGKLASRRVGLWD